MANPPRKRPRTPARRRRVKPKLIDWILDYPYERMFCLKGRLVIAAVIVIGLAVKLVVGINTVTLDPMTCELAGIDSV